MEKHLKNDIKLILEIGSLYDAILSQKAEERRLNKVGRQSNVVKMVVEQMNLNEMIPTLQQAQTLRTCHDVFKGRKQIIDKNERKTPGRKSLVNDEQLNNLVVEIQQRIDNQEFSQKNLFSSLTVSLLQELLKKCDSEYDFKVSHGHYGATYLRGKLRNAIMEKFRSKPTVAGNGDVESSDSDTEDCSETSASSSVESSESESESNGPAVTCLGMKRNIEDVDSQPELRTKKQKNCDSADVHENSEDADLLLNVDVSQSASTPGIGSVLPEHADLLVNDAVSKTAVAMNSASTPGIGSVLPEDAEFYDVSQAAVTMSSASTSGIGSVLPSWLNAIGSWVTKR